MLFRLFLFGCRDQNMCNIVIKASRKKKHWLVFFYVWNKCRDNQKKSFLRQLNRDMHVYKYAEREQFLALEYIDFFMFLFFIEQAKSLVWTYFFLWIIHAKLWHLLNNNVVFTLDYLQKKLEIPLKL